jgi:zeaxanthin glucosyltransferase
MTRVLCATLPERGHLHPFFGPAAALRDAGHEVVFFTPHDVGEVLAEAGFSEAVVPDGAGPPPHGSRGAAFAAVLRDPPTLAGWVRSLLLDHTEARLPGVRAVLRDVRPDVVALDPMDDAVALACDLEGVPWVGWSSSLNPVIPDDWTSDLAVTTRSIAAARGALWRARGLVAPAFRISDALSPRGTATFATEALTGPAPAGVRLVGPSRPPVEAGWAWRPAGRTAFVSFGSQAWHQPALFEAAFEAAAAVGLGVVASAGELAGSLARPGVAAFGWVPQRAVLRQVDVVLSHGGANSVLEALDAGAPLVVVPLCNDQPHNARLVAAAGVGVVVPPEAATAERLKVAFETALTRCAGPARAMAASFAARDGNTGAARLVLEAR